MQLENGERVEELGLHGLKILQSDNLYRFTSDAVLLTRFAAAKYGDVVADFCSGSGIVGLHFYALNREKIKEVQLFELQKELADLSARSVAINGLEEIFTVHNTPLQEIGSEYSGYFSLILCNPPYEKNGAGETSLSRSDRLARHEITITLEEVIKIASNKLKYGGRFCLCHRADRLCDIICEMRAAGLEPKRIKFASPKGKAPYLVFAEGVKGGKPCLKIESSFEN